MRTFRTTTALIASLSLMLPGTLPAQEGDGVQITECPEGAEPPCPPANGEAPAAEGEAVEKAPEAEGAASQEAPADAAAEPGQAEQPADEAAEPAPAEQPADEAVAPEQAEQPAPEAAAPEQVGEDVSEDVAAPGEAAEVAPAPAQDQGAEAQPEAEAEPAAETQATEDAEGEPQAAPAEAAEAPAPEGDSKAQAGPAAQGAASADAAAEAPAAELAGEGDDIVETLQDGLPADGEPEAEAPAESAAEDQASQADETADPADTAEGDAAAEAPVTDAESGAAADASTAPAADAETSPDAVTADEAAPGEDAAAAQDAAAAEEPAPAVDNGAAKTAEGDAEAKTQGSPQARPKAVATEAPAAAQPAEAAAATADENNAAEVTEEVVTEETARSSDEEFETTLEAAPSKSKGADAGADKDKEEGLSQFERALLVGLGAFAAGKVLSDGRQVVTSSGDRVVVEQGGDYQLIKDDDALLRQPGAEVRTETFDDGSTRTTVTREDGSQIVTIRDAELRVLRRVRITPDGERIVLIDDTTETKAVDVSRLPEPRRATQDAQQSFDEAALRRALEAEADVGRRFTLRQVRTIPQVRALAPAVELDNITFETGSAAITPDQARELSDLGRTIAAAIEQDPREVFLIEGHTDAVGDAAYNLALSDRRAETVALALTEYFEVPPENLVVQGYGEKFLKVETDGPERANRRATVRRITELLQTAAAN